MTEAIRIDDLTFLVKRSERRKTVGITVERDGSVLAHLPRDTDLDRVGDLIRTRLVWVHQKLASHKYIGRESVFRRPEFVDGEGFHFLGKHYRLKLIDVPPTAPPTSAVRFEGDRLLFRRDQVEAGHRRIEDYYTRAARPYLNDAVSRWKRIVGVEPARYVKIMDLGFHWASCGLGAMLNFHWRVMQLAPPLIDYVVVHELAHLKFRDHSPEFWREVHRVLPSFQKLKSRLSERGGEL